MQIYAQLMTTPTESPTPAAKIDPADTPVTRQEIKLVTLELDGFHSTVNVNAPIAIGVPILIVLAFIFVPKIIRLVMKGATVKKVEINLPFGGGKVEISPCFREKLIAHKIWTELVTRKAALPFEKDKDVILAVYDSWYALFGIVRKLIREIPIDKLHGSEKESVEHLIELALNVLNNGLRPHLTKWQPAFRKWHEKQPINGDDSPQELQKRYKYYEEIVDDIQIVNAKLVILADDLKNVVNR